MAQEKGAGGGKESAREAREAARGKGDGKGDDYEFIPPDFDEDAFIHREMVSFRTTLILFIWGIVAALVSWGIFFLMGGVRTGWLVGLGIMAVFGYSLRYLFPRLKADVTHFGRREWLGTAALFFFTWMAFFLVAVNPPVSDFAAPRVDIHPSPLSQTPDGTVSVNLFLEDNVRVDSHEVRVLSGGTVLASTEDFTSLGRGHYRFDAQNLTPGSYSVEVEARDGRGHEGNGSATFTVGEALLDYSATGGGVLAGAADRVLVKTGTLDACRTNDDGQVNTRDACVRTVRLEMAGGGGRAVTLQYIDAEDAWVATSAHRGWAQGNNTFDVVAEMADRYQGSGAEAVRFDGGQVRDGPHSIDVRATPGDLDIQPAADPGPGSHSVPGLGLPALMLALLAAVVLLARRR